MRAHKLPEAGVVLSEATRLGAPGDSDEVGLNPLLEAIRRERGYANLCRAPHLKAGSSSLARSPWRANIFDPRHLKSTSVDVERSSAAPSPPMLWLVDATNEAVAVQWVPHTADEALIDGYELQMGAHEVRYDGTELVEAYRPFERVAQMGEEARTRTVNGLQQACSYRLRVRARTAVVGEWSNVIDARTATTAGGVKDVYLPVPAKWLGADTSDLHAGLGCTAEEFGRECQGALLPHVKDLKTLYSMLTVHGGGKGLNRQGFSKFAKEMGLGKSLGSGEVDLIFQRSNLSSNGEDDGGLNAMNEAEFANGLIRLAWAYGDGADESQGGGEGSIGIGGRLNHLLGDVVVPRNAHLLRADDDFNREMRTSQRVEAITEFYRTFLLDVFEVYSRADVTINQAKGHLQTMNFPELLFLCKEGQLLDERLSLLTLTTIFRRTNMDAMATGVDDSTAELSFSEFILVLAQVANAKYPPETRGGQPFDSTWQSFLSLIFVPKFKKLLKAKRQGAARQTIDGKCF